MATFRIETLEGVVLELCSLGPDVEVLEPADLRAAVAACLLLAARQYRGGGRARSARRP